MIDRTRAHAPDPLLKEYMTVHSRQVRVCVAEDHEIVRDGLKALIDGQPDLRVVGTAADGESAIRVVRTEQADVLVLDISMPGMNGIEATVRLTRDHDPVRIVILSVHEDRSYFRRLVAAGARAYVLKRSPMAHLIQAIRTVSAGGLYVDAALPADMLFDSKSVVVAHGEGTELTSREVEVVRLVARGLSNREIAATLQISVKTVETHKARINEKMQFSSRADLVRYSLRTGLLAPEPE
jgi:DNA-binding NarL/FixJ family response regulator